MLTTGEPRDVFRTGVRFSEPLNIREFPDTDPSPCAPEVDHHHLPEVRLRRHLTPSRFSGRRSGIGCGSSIRLARTSARLSSSLPLLRGRQVFFEPL